ncbi:MAG: DUF1413 domain-containing protein [Spirochaetales bacterium]|nr:DUF1413 domain-containing protein [Spirochaetales bacterium]
MEIEEMFEQVKTEVATLRRLSFRDGFIVRDLFPLGLWYSHPQDIRTRLGAMVFNWVDSEACSYMVPAGKTDKNQEIYRIVG